MAAATIRIYDRDLNASRSVRGDLKHRSRLAMTLPGLWLVTLGTSAWIGCTGDTRMSVYEFMEREQPPTAPPATQPVVASSQSDEQLSQPLSAGPYRVGPDDVLSVNIPGLEAVGLQNDFTLRVNQRGQVTLPSVGPLDVSGMTLDEVEAQIQKHYSPQFIKNAQVSVLVDTYGTIDVTVLGDIQQAPAATGPPTVQLRRDKTSVLGAILASGGPPDLDGKVTLIPARTPSKPTVFCLSNRADLIRAARVGVVQQSDIILVDARSNNEVYVLGLVNRPGPIPVTRSASLSVLQALGAAGGTMLKFEPREATLMRRQLNGELMRVKINLDQVMQGTEPDIRLAAGDVLLVPHNAETRIEEFIAENFIFRFGVDATYYPWTDYYFWKNYRQVRKQNAQNGTQSLFSLFGTLNQFTGGLNAIPVGGQ